MTEEGITFEDNFRVQSIISLPLTGLYCRHLRKVSFQELESQAQRKICGINFAYVTCYRRLLVPTLSYIPLVCILYVPYDFCQKIFNGTILQLLFIYIHVGCYQQTSVCFPSKCQNITSPYLQPLIALLYRILDFSYKSILVISKVQEKMNTRKCYQG